MIMKIYIHSYINLITNSSTEIFISANEKTLAAIRSIVDNVLAAGGSSSKADDLFSFELVVEDPDSYPTKHYLVDSPEGQKIIDDNEDANEYRGSKRAVRVTAKVGVEGRSLDDTAKVLSNLAGLFEIDAWYNG